MQFGAKKLLTLATAMLATVGYTFNAESSKENFESFLKDRDEKLKGDGKSLAEALAANGVDLDEGETAEAALAALVAKAEGTEAAATEITTLKGEVTKLKGDVTNLTAAKDTLSTQIKGVKAAGVKLAEDADEEAAKKAVADRVSIGAREQLAKHGLSLEEAPEGDNAKGSGDPKPGTGAKELNGLARVTAAFQSNTK